jgi:hypothetical protein
MAGNNIIQAASISPQVLLSQQLGTSDVSLYTVAAGQSVKLAQGSLCNVSSLTAAPTLTLGTTSSSGGTFAAGTCYWKVTAKSVNGETLGSNEVSATLVANGTQALSCTNVAGAAYFNWYRGTTAGGENVLVASTTTNSYTDTGTAGGAASVPSVSTFSAPASVFLSIVKAGGTIGDGTHRVIHNYSLAGNDTLPLHDYIAGAMLGPGDAISAYSSMAGAVDLIVTGTVHA